MKTNLASRFHNRHDRPEIESILRACVHCGFCTATCPTYLDLRDERDGPRGRIYLIKQLVEGGEVSGRTRDHLDRCLTCRSCETTCPAGVRYGALIDSAREIVEQEIPRPFWDRGLRRLLRAVLPYPRRFGPLLRLGQAVRPLLPRALARFIPERRAASPWPARRHRRVMLVLEGCVQPSAAPGTNAAAARVLDRLGISLVAAPEAGCCGAVSLHLAATEEARAFMRRNIDAWWPAVEAGAEAIVTTASGCGSTIRDYGRVLADDHAYAAKAKRIASLARDLSQILLAEDLAPLAIAAGDPSVAVHVPCSLYHGQSLPDSVENVLRRLGFTLTPTKDKHLCCGSAGTYSILQPAMSRRLRDQKLAALSGGAPSAIVTANIGCQLHLQEGTTTPVRHWIELVAEAMSP